MPGANGVEVSAEHNAGVCGVGEAPLVQQVENRLHLVPPGIRKDPQRAWRAERLQMRIHELQCTDAAFGADVDCCRERHATLPRKRHSNGMLDVSVAPHCRFGRAATASSRLASDPAAQALSTMAASVAANTLMTL
jgi:hypothetical protein